MAANITIATAFLAGLVSFLSPCVLPLVPPYLVYLAGASLERLAGAEPEPRVRRDTIAAAALFVAGFSSVFVALGATATSIGLGLHRLQGVLADWIMAFSTATGIELPSFNPFALLAGLIIIIMGLHFLGVTPIALLNRQARPEIGKPIGLWGAYVMGLAFAAGWSPCIGPTLGAILLVAGSQGTPASGAGLLAIYSLGLGLPFVIAAFAVEPFAALLVRFRGHLAHVERVMGGLLILTGLAFFFDVFTQLNSWILEAFPALQNIG
jgi:cytochrome c-type biogenesis protein